MYKNTKSTSRSSIARKQPSNKAYLEKLYEHSKTIFVGREIISQKLFGDLPEAPPLGLISSNKKYLSRIGYLETQIAQLPDWFLFHPKLGVLIRCLREAGRTNRNIVPFELELIAFGDPPKAREMPGTRNSRGVDSSETRNPHNKLNREPIKTPLELAFEKAKAAQK